MINLSEYKYWSVPGATALTDLEASSQGLTHEQASERLKQYGANTIKSKANLGPVFLFLNQFKNPIMIILIVATVISALTGDVTDSLIIMGIVLASVVLSFLQEYTASQAVEELRSRIQLQSTVIRNDQTIDISTEEIVPGDIVLLSAGSLVPADGLVLEANDFFVNQSILTGEALPVEKVPVQVSETASIADRQNSVFTGTNVFSGSAKILAVRTGANTEFGQIAKDLTLRPPENDFERGIRHFGYLMTQIMLLLTLIVFAVNVLAKKPAIDSLLFSVALAVGITPQLLPAIINITLSKGSKTMAKEGVIVRHLTAIENFGSMDVLCTDKTGTLTEGVVKLDGAFDTEGQISDEVYQKAFYNAAFQTGMKNSLDQAIMDYRPLDISAVTKQDEIPYDFTRKRLSIIVNQDDQCMMITKGALQQVLAICRQMAVGSELQMLDQAALDQIQARFADWSNQGYRVLGMATKNVEPKPQYAATEETDMVFIGFLLFFDPPKADAMKTINDLKQLGVDLRIITGDNRLIALHTADSIGLPVEGSLTGEQLIRMSEEELWNAIDKTTIFTEVDPNQKERIILALKKKNHVVGYMGDGINDAPALHAADVSISVNTAVDVAKEAADFVLLEKSLDVLRRGIVLGRTTFANTLKYINITTSANFGNMFSMAGASLFMPFLPLLPKQILLLNFISDFPALTIAGDTVDQEMLEKPRRWDIRDIRNFMITFGFISSVFDYVTFGVLLLWFRAGEGQFQSSWFLVSILTELLVLLVMRTRRPFFQSKPAPLLLLSSIGVGIFSVILPYLPVKALLGIEPIPLPILLSLFGIAAAYILTTEIGKRLYYRNRR